MVTKRDTSNEKFASKCVDKKYLQEDGGYVLICINSRMHYSMRFN